MSDAASEPFRAIWHDSFPTWFLPLTCVIGIAVAVVLWYRVGQVKVGEVDEDDQDDALLQGEDGQDATEVLKKVADIQAAIADGANSFLITEYQFIAVFMILFSVIIFVLLGFEGGFDSKWGENEDGSWDGETPALYNAIFSTVAFLLGAITSCVCGFLGMKIATFANARTTLEARKGITAAFICAFRSGAVMGYLLTSLGLLVLYITILAYRAFFITEQHDDWIGVYEAIAGYGLGGSAIALFGRVGGGIYTKAADVGADLVGKVEAGIPEDDPRNPAVIADNVGDNVGDIAGMGADLFGSFAESTCAALVIASVSSLGTNEDYVAMNYPLLISAVGILGCFLTSLVALECFPVKEVSGIERALKIQLIVSTLVLTPAIYLITLYTVPHTFELPDILNPGEVKVVRHMYLFACVMCGLWGGLIIGLVTEIYTSNAWFPVQEVAESCRTGAATNIIFGLALGYLSVIIPVVVVAMCIFVGFSLAGMLGIACAALGMLSNLATCLTIDAYGPVCDNAGGIAEMAELGEHIRERTDALDAAGNTTAAIGKGFAIGSAALVSLALFGAYITRAGIDVNSSSILSPEIFTGLLLGAMLPYWFSAMTMKSVGKAALAMVDEVRRQFQDPGVLEGTVKPDYKRCVAISTQASLYEMIPPGLLVMLTPVAVGALLGTRTLAGVLAGALVSGVQLAVSMSNTGGAWDNAKKYIAAAATEKAEALGGKGSDAHKAAVIGDTVGDPMKDTSGPSLNILIKLMAVESLVFAPFFANAAGGKGYLFQFFV